MLRAVKLGLGLALGLGFGSARADEWDYGFQFTNVAAAISDGQAQGVYDPSSPRPGFLSDPALAFVLDRTKREAGQGSFVVQNNIGGIIGDLACGPLFASTNPYPVGGFQ